MGEEYLLEKIETGDTQEVKDILWGKIYKPKDLFNAIVLFFDNVELTKEIWSFFKIYPRLKINTVFRCGRGRRSNEISFLLTAIQKNQFEIFQELLRVPKINVNQMVMRYRRGPRGFFFKKEKYTPLFFAIEQEKLRFVEALLKIPTLKPNQKCLINYECYGNMDNVDSKRNYIHADKANIETLKLLVTRNDLDVNLKNQHGYNKLQIACDNGDLEVIKILFEKKDLDVNDRCDSVGFTPLMLAGLQNHIEVAKLLLTHDYIHTNAKNFQGQTAFSVITNKEIKEFIRSHSKQSTKKRRMK